MTDLTNNLLEKAFRELQSQRQTHPGEEGMVLHETQPPSLPP
jgi:hypothetical protein